MTQKKLIPLVPENISRGTQLFYCDEENAIKWIVLESDESGFTATDMPGENEGERFEFSCLQNGWEVFRTELPNNYYVEVNDWMGKLIIAHPEIGGGLAEFTSFEEAKEYAERG
jgi:hypothetical protein